MVVTQYKLQGGGKLAAATEHEASGSGDSKRQRNSEAC
jgi:hypothetical protein